MWLFNVLERRVEECCNNCWWILSWILYEIGWIFELWWAGVWSKKKKKMEKKYKLGDGEKLK